MYFVIQTNGVYRYILVLSRALWSRTSKLERVIENGTRQCSSHLEIVLAHELTLQSTAKRTQCHPGRPCPLAGAERHLVHEGHLAEPISIATLAQLVRLSRFYFCGDLVHEGQSFGIPPHRSSQRPAHGVRQDIVGETHVLVTHVGLKFRETSSFDTAFRKITGLTSTAYRQGLA